MEVKAIGQGGQPNIEINKNMDKMAQVNNVRPLERGKIDDNKNTGSKDISETELKNAVDKLNNFLEDNKTHAEYEYHDKFKNDVMIKIIDDKTGEIIQEVPPKRILDMVAKMLELVGVLIDKKA
jgi:flagellar protein FlaG